MRDSIRTHVQSDGGVIITKLVDNSNDEYVAYWSNALAHENWAFGRSREEAIDNLRSQRMLRY